MHAPAGLMAHTVRLYWLQPVGGARSARMIETVAVERSALPATTSPMVGALQREMRGRHVWSKRRPKSVHACSWCRLRHEWQQPAGDEYVMPSLVEPGGGAC